MIRSRHIAAVLALALAGAAWGAPAPAEEIVVVQRSSSILNHSLFQILNRVPGSPIALLNGHGHIGAGGQILDHGAPQPNGGPPPVVIDDGLTMGVALNGTRLGALFVGPTCYFYCDNSDPDEAIIPPFSHRMLIGVALNTDRPRRLIVNFRAPPPIIVEPPVVEPVEVPILRPPPVTPLPDVTPLPSVTDIPEAISPRFRIFPFPPVTPPPDVTDVPDGFSPDFGIFPFPDVVNLPSPVPARFGLLPLPPVAPLPGIFQGPMVMGLPGAVSPRFNVMSSPSVTPLPAATLGMVSPMAGP